MPTTSMSLRRNDGGGGGDHRVGGRRRPAGEQNRHAAKVVRHVAVGATSWMFFGHGCVSAICGSMPSMMPDVVVNAVAAEFRPVDC